MTRKEILKRLQLTEMPVDLVNKANPSQFIGILRLCTPFWVNNLVSILTSQSDNAHMVCC